MAEPVEQNPSLPAAPPSAGVFPGETAASEEQTYRALPITALIGFGLAALYAAAIGVGALVGLFSRKPLLLSGWSAVAPLMAILLCLLAWGRIRVSEGTLAGASLVRWGLLLSLFFGLSYWAYFFAVSVAVQQQARAFADSWLQQLSEGDLRKGAMGVLPPIKRLGLSEDDPGFTAEVENRFAAMEGPGRSASLYNLFNQFPLVRTLSQAGKEAVPVMRRVDSWDYVDGGYRVVFLYDLETPEGTISAKVAVHGVEAPSNEFEHRQWYVELGRTSLDDSSRKPSNFGIAVDRVNLEGQLFIRDWQQKLHEPVRDGVFVFSLPGDQREKALASLKKITPLAAVAGPLGTSLSSPEGDTLQQLTRFIAGGPLRFDLQGAIAEQERAEVVADLHRIIARGPFQRKLNLQRIPPRRTVVDGRVRLGFDLQISGPNLYVIDCVLELEGNATTLETAAVEADFRLVALRVVSARKVTPEQSQQQR